MNFENVLAEAPEHVRKNIIERLLAQPDRPDRPGGKRGGKGDKGAGRGRPKGGPDASHPTVEGTPEQVQALIQGTVNPREPLPPHGKLRRRIPRDMDIFD